MAYCFQIAVLCMCQNPFNFLSKAMKIIGKTRKKATNAGFVSLRIVLNKDVVVSKLSKLTPRNVMIRRAYTDIIKIVDLCFFTSLFFFAKEILKNGRKLWYPKKEKWYEENSIIGHHR